MSCTGFRLLSRLYPIVDPAALGPVSPVDFGTRLLDAGAPILQLRGKGLSTRELLDVAHSLQRQAARHGALLIVNDRPDVARIAGAAGVHLGQSDLPPDDARRILGPDAVIGLSTHDAEQVRHASGSGAIDYIGFGPIFPTASKRDAGPCQDIDGLRRVRATTALPIVAIGGITFETAAAVLAAGADAVAMIGGLVADPDTVLRALL